MYWIKFYLWNVIKLFLLKCNEEYSFLFFVEYDFCVIFYFVGLKWKLNIVEMLIILNGFV